MIQYFSVQNLTGLIPIIINLCRFFPIIAGIFVFSTSSQSYKKFTSEIYKNSAVFLQVFKIQSYKAFFTSEFFWWILQVDFTLEKFWIL